MRKLNLVAVLAAAGSLMLAGGAKAASLVAPLIPGNTVDLVWTAASNPGAVLGGLGTDSITLNPAFANTLTLSVVQNVGGANSIAGIFGAIAYDLDLGDELNGAGPPAAFPAPASPPPGTLTEVGLGLPAYGNLAPNAFFGAPPGYNDPILARWAESTGAQSGYGLGLDAINISGVPAPSGVTFTSFTVTFTVNGGNLASDGPGVYDVFFGAFGTGNAIGTDGGGLIYAGSGPWAGAAVQLAPEPGTAALLALGLGGLAAAARRRKSA